MDKNMLYATVDKINKKIIALRAMGFNVQEFENLRDKILTDSNVNIQNNPNLSLEQIYTNTINNLEKLYRKLLDYEILVISYQYTILIKEVINEQENKEDIINYQEKLKLIIKNLRNFKKLDYKAEIIENNLDENKKIEILKRLNDDIDKYYNSLCNIYEELKNISKPTSNSKPKGHFTRDSLKLIFHSMLIATLLIGSFKIGKLTSTGEIKTYMTKTTTYNPLNKNPYTITEQYEPKQNDSILAIYYGPIDIYGRRTVNTYNLSNYKSTSLEEIYNINLPSIMIPDYSGTLEDSDLSAEIQESFRIIKEVRVNLDDVNVTSETGAFARVLFTFFFLLVSILIYAVYSYEILKRKKDYLPFISDLMNVLKDLQGFTPETEECEKRLKDIVIRLDDLITNNKPLINKAIIYANNLKDNEEYYALNDDLRREIELVRDKEKGLRKILKKIAVY